MSRAAGAAAVVLSAALFAWAVAVIACGLDWIEILQVVEGAPK